MENDVILHLPWPPTVNSYYGTARSGHKYVAKKGVAFRDAVESALHEQAPRLNIDTSMFVEVYLYPPDKRKRDLDNYMKALLDALTLAKLWEDDSLIDQLHIYRGVTVKGGLVCISISDGAPVLPVDYIQR